ncbi:MAG: diguanylate cyclase [Synergistaceae bacterium]|jgi:diguanylate cyclase (GGDEF)-like protein|nr:diguanylate cyclase [Synergistaceae bacterium]
MAAVPQDQQDAPQEPAEKVLFNYVRDLIYNPSHASLDLDRLPENFKTFGKGLLYLGECLMEAMAMAKSLSKGDLNCKTPSRGNEIAAPLKALHATLKHLTWQTQQVAKGDYKQRVSFMGEFADSFNEMIEQLDQRRDALLQEIAGNIRKSEALAQNNSLLEAITANITQWIVVVDRESNEWLYANRDTGDVLGDIDSEPQLREWISENLEEVEDILGQYVVDLELPKRNGIQYFSAAIHPLQWYDHAAVAFVFTDVSSAKRRLHKLENVAYYDPLTKAFNRHYGMETLTEWLGQGNSFVICFVDMDNLKYVNDKFGHAEGDKYITLVVGILRHFSPDAIICRLGGDEFMLLAENCSAQDADERLEELRDRLLTYNDEPDCAYNHSMSYGTVEVLGDNTMSASELLGIADEKMYKYKRAHKMQRQVTVPELTASVAHMQPPS